MSTLVLVISITTLYGNTLSVTITLSFTLGKRKIRQMALIFSMSEIGVRQCA